MFSSVRVHGLFPGENCSSTLLRVCLLRSSFPYLSERACDHSIARWVSISAVKFEAITQPSCRTAQRTAGCCNRSFALRVKFATLARSWYILGVVLSCDESNLPPHFRSRIQGRNAQSPVLFNNSPWRLPRMCLLGLLHLPRLLFHSCTHWHCHV